MFCKEAWAETFIEIDDEARDGEERPEEIKIRSPQLEYQNMQSTAPWLLLYNFDIQRIYFALPWWTGSEGPE